MKLNKKIFFLILLIVFALTLGACSGGGQATITGWSGITTKEDVVYFSYGSFVYSLNSKNGSKLWQYPMEAIRGVDFYAAPTLADQDSQLIVGDYNNTIHSLDPKSGLKKWEYIVPKKENQKTRFIASPLVTEEAIYAPASDHNLYAIDFDGLALWTFTTEDPIWASPTISETCGCIYLASMDRHLYALNPDNGNLLWKTDDLGGPIVSQPTVSDNGLVIVSTFNDEVIAIDEESHQVAWRFSTNDWAWAHPVIDGEQVYASDIAGTFYALDLETGDMNWQLQPGGGIYSAPLVKDGQILFSAYSKDTSSLIVVSSEGVIQRNQPIDGKLYASPAANGDNILLAPSEAEYFIIAFNQNGVQVWGYPPPK